jgi:hypothetical protein
MATGQETNQPSGAQTTQEWDALKGDVGEMAGAAMDQGRHILDSAREQATGYADQRKNDLAQSVVDLANTLRESGSAFDNRPGIHAIVEGAAGGLEQLADTIRARSFGDMFGDVEAMVRRRPVMAAAATMTAGFLLARFVKASAGGAREAGMRSGQTYRAAGPGASSRGQAGT